MTKPNRGDDRNRTGGVCRSSEYRVAFSDRYAERLRKGWVGPVKVRLDEEDKLQMRVILVGEESDLISPVWITINKVIT